MATNRALPTLGVLGVYTGLVLKQGGFDEIHETLDHLYPGIMTLGCAHMAETARAEVLRQHPEFAELPPCNSENWEEWATVALEKFGPTIPILGPHGSGNPDMYDANAQEPHGR